MSKKIAVVGTGANGGGTAAAITQAGYDVVLIDQWPAHVEAMRANGLQINFPDETINVPVEAYHLCDVCTLNQMFDIVLVMVTEEDGSEHDYQFDFDAQSGRWEFAERDLLERDFGDEWVEGFVEAVEKMIKEAVASKG